MTIKDSEKYCENKTVYQQCLKIATDEFFVYNEIVYLCKEHSDEFEKSNPQGIVELYGKNWRSRYPYLQKIDNPSIRESILKIIHWRD